MGGAVCLFPRTTRAYFTQFAHPILEAGTAPAPRALLGESESTGWKSLEVRRWLLGYVLLRGVWGGRGGRKLSPFQIQRHTALPGFLSS